MWPFNKKTIVNPAGPVSQQLELKSVTLAQALPNWFLGSVKQHGWDTSKAIIEGYNASAIVYACIEKRAKLVAAVPWCVKVRGKDDDGKEIWENASPNHPLAKLIARPNPAQSFHELMYQASQNMDLSGSGFLSKIRAGVGNLPRELWLLPSQYVEVKPGREKLIDYWKVSAYGVRASKQVMPEDMCQLKFPNPSSVYFGQPTLLSAGKPTDIDRESGVWQKVSLENRGASDINIKLPEGATQDQVDQIRSQYKKQQEGSKNARKALITNADVQVLGQTAVELDFVASRRAVWTEICAVFGMSLSNLGMTENVNLANAEAMDKALYLNTIIPNLDLMCEQLNHSLAYDFGDDVRIEYDLSNVRAMQQGTGEKLEHAQKLWQMGVPLADINQKLELGLTEREWYEIGYIQSGLIPTSYDVDEEDNGETAELDGVNAYGNQSDDVDNANG